MKCSRAVMAPAAARETTHFDSEARQPFGAGQVLLLAFPPLTRPLSSVRSGPTRSRSHDARRTNPLLSQIRVERARSAEVNPAPESYTRRDGRPEARSGPSPGRREVGGSREVGSADEDGRPGLAGWSAFALEAGRGGGRDGRRREAGAKIARNSCPRPSSSAMVCLRGLTQDHRCVSDCDSHGMWRWSLSGGLSLSLSESPSGCVSGLLSLAVPGSIL